MKSIISALAVLGLLLTASAPAQGVDIPCAQCDSLEHQPRPTSGAWFNPKESGSGFTLEVQNQTLVGYYYGYDETGAQAWYIFNGQLENPEPESDAVWTFEGDLQSLSGGACIDCPYVAPIMGEPRGTISIEFLQPNHARYSINGGGERFLVPLLFGVPGFAYLEEETEYLFPELKGDWVAVLEIAEPEPFGGLRIFTSHVFMGNFIKEDTEDGNFGIGIFQETNGSEVRVFGGLTCGYINEAEVEPRCELDLVGTDDQGITTRQFFNVPLAYLSSEEITGEAENGDILTLKKLDVTCVRDCE